MTKNFPKKKIFCKRNSKNESCGSGLRRKQQNIRNDKNNFVVFVKKCKMKKNKEELLEIPTVGELLYTEFMEPLGLSQSALAEAIGVPQNRISDIVNGKRAISFDTDLRLCRFFKMSDGFFARVQQRLEQARMKREMEDELSRIKPYANDNFEDDDLMMM